LATNQSKKRVKINTDQSSSQMVAPNHDALNQELRIFQIYYQPWQLELLDAHLIPFDNGQHQSELLEVDVFQRLSTSDQIQGARLWGALSWRFTEKTGMTGAQLIKEIESQPGYDVYYCNPEVIHEALFHNLWMQGETSHPDFLKLCMAIFEAANLPMSQLIALSSSKTYSSTNSFVATPQFWQSYLPWIQQILNLANKKLPPQVRDMMHSSRADDRGLHKGATYVPFIVERLFPIFLKTVGQQFKSHQLTLPVREEKLNVHLRLLREMKDMACQSQSIWMANCWLNYRNLYLTQVQKKDWCAKYLPLITPKQIVFS
jgi:hypothetical protein